MLNRRQGAFALVLGVGLWCGVAWATPEEDYKEALLAQGKDDLQTAMTLFKRAADGGHPLAMVSLGTILDQAEENEAGATWLRKAADIGEPSGMERLGEMLINGEVGKGREKEGLAWIEKAAGQKYGPSMVVLAKMVLTGRSFIPAEPERAMALLRGSAEAGYVPAIKELVRIYRQGADGIPPDSAQAQAWEAKLPKAAEPKSKTVTRKKADRQ